MMFETEQVVSDHTPHCAGIFHDAQVIITYAEVGINSYAVFLADPKTTRPVMYLGAVADNLVFMPSAELPVDRTFSNLDDAIIYLTYSYGVQYRMHI